MKKVNSSTVEFNAKDQQLVHYIIKMKGDCSVTEIMKLAYLIDIGFKKVKGKRFSNFNFVRYYYGPFTKEIYAILDKLLSEGNLILEENLAIDGKSIYKTNPQKPFIYSELKEEDLAIINQLLQEIIGYNALQLTNLAYKTEPMKALNATLGGNEHLWDTLDFDKVISLCGAK